MIRGGLFEEEEEDIFANGVLEVLAPTSFHRTLSAPLHSGVAEAT